MLYFLYTGLFLLIINKTLIYYKLQKIRLYNSSRIFKTNKKLNL